MFPSRYKYSHSILSLKITQQKLYQPLRSKVTLPGLMEDELNVRVYANGSDECKRRGFWLPNTLEEAEKELTEEQRYVSVTHNDHSHQRGSPG